MSSSKDERAGEESIKDMKKEFDKRIDEMQNKLDKSLKQGKKVLEGDDEAIGDLKEQLHRTRIKMTDLMESGEDVVREHPLIIVGGVLAFGFLLGVLVGRKSND